MSELCPVCKKPLHWRRKNKLSGIVFKDKGRPRKYDYSAIRKMKVENQGLSIRELAHLNKCTTSSVQRALRKPHILKRMSAKGAAKLENEK